MSKQQPRSRNRRILRAAAITLAVICMSPFVLTLLYGLVTPPSTLMIAHWLKGQGVERQVVSLDQVSQTLIASVVASEDARFCEHIGVDTVELRGQLERLSDGEGVRGASTISMQVVKNLFLWSGRSYVRKALELPLALWLDLVLPKTRILELYLNIAEWGDGVFGIEAAAQHHFNVSASQLTRVQAARLATTLPNPQLRNPVRPTPGHRRLSARVYGIAPTMGPYLTCLK